MKKIILALMMTFSFSFAVQSELCVSINGNYVKVLLAGYWGDYASGVCISVNGYDVSKNKYFVKDGGSCYWNASAFSGYAYYLTTTACSPTPTCTASQELINNVCVEKCPSGQERIDGVCVNSCNQMIGEFRKSDGTCQDCVPYTNFSSRSFCACDSQGTTYTPQALVTTTQTNGNYSYKKTNITCDNGLRIAIYTDPVNINPQDYNATLNQNGTVSPDTNHTTTPTDNNSTYTPPVQTNNDVVEAIKATTDVSKEIKGEIGKVATDVKAMNEHLAKQGTTFNETLTAIKANGTESVKTNQLLTDLSASQSAFKTKFDQFATANQANANAQLGATNGVKSAVNGTTNAVNAQGKNITDKLDEVIKAIKEDGNGTSPNDGNDTGKDIDLNETNKKLDTLHDDNNKTHSILDKISGFLDSNTTVDTNRSGSSLTISDMLPDGGWGWFTTNSIKPKFNISSNNCYCQTAEFTVAGRNFLFPSKELLDMIPFNAISNMFMAFIYVLGLKSFLRN